MPENRTLLNVQWILYDLGHRDVPPAAYPRASNKEKYARFLVELDLYVSQYNCVPSPSYITSDGWPLGQLADNYRTTYRTRPDDPRFAELDSKPHWWWSRKNVRPTTAEWLAAIACALGTTDNWTARLQVKIGNLRNRYKQGILSEEWVTGLEATQFWEWYPWHGKYYGPTFWCGVKDLQTPLPEATTSKERADRHAILCRWHLAHQAGLNLVGKLTARSGWLEFA